MVRLSNDRAWRAVFFSSFLPAPSFLADFTGFGEFAIFQRPHILKVASRLCLGYCNRFTKLADPVSHSIHGTCGSSEHHVKGSGSQRR